MKFAWLEKTSDANNDGLNMGSTKNKKNQLLPTRLRRAGERSVKTAVDTKGYDRVVAKL
jgi:hypothetical protein